MAAGTDPSLQNQVIYSVFVRNHTPEGTFRAIIPDLPRIRALGTDIVWLMPIHPLGRKARKGSLGSPYANRDYRAVNPEYGTLDDFRMLVDAIHDQGMRCIIDVVYNHTSPDSVLWETHPEWFYLRPDETPGNHVGDWTDIIDLDYSLPTSTVPGGLWDYQIQTLVEWARIVDGFRCDVASFVPVEFWLRARAACEEVRPGCIWLAETVHRSFGQEMRRRGLYCATDAQAYQAFDIEYAYDVQECFDDYLAGRTTLSHWVDLLDFQEAAYPAGFNKLRHLENHDLPRIASRLEEVPGRTLSLESLTAMLFLLKGTTLVYAGQEVAATHVPTLFDRDTIDFGHLGTSRDLSPLLARLSRMKHEALAPDDFVTFRADDKNDLVVITREGSRGRTVGVFPLRGGTSQVAIGLPDGEYEDLVAGKAVTVHDGSLLVEGHPVIVRG